ncbi:MAG: hypothetical protein D6674_03590 [Acidobacteria bacterium]|jgi:hypothetical protein|nr:MAG: hypothetical protein D6674_03590 [Acidobacteriota bacterium]
MAQEHWDFINILVIVARFIQVLGFFFAVIMLIKEFPLVYTFLVFLINLLGFFFILVGILAKAFSLLGVILVDALIIAVSLLLFLRAYRIKKERERYPPSPKPYTRCPVCGSLIRNDSFCAIMDSKSILYFDSKEHMEAFLGAPNLYWVSKEINYDGVRKVCVNRKVGWVSYKDYIGGLSPQEVTL